MKNHKASLILSLLTLSILFSSSSSSAFNITKILSQHREFQTLNSLLSQTKLADEINRRRTITVLAVDDAGLSSLAGKPLGLVRKILSVHVVLDYFDVEKLTKLGISANISTLTTLFQASGLAAGQQGFLNVSLVGEGEIAFGSAAAGGALDSKLVEPVAAQPYDLSVLQITAPVRVPGIESAPQPPPARVPAPAPEKSPSVPTPAPKKSPAPATTVAPALAPAVPPAADGPAASDVPAGSPPKPAADSEPLVQNTSGGGRRGSVVGVGAAVTAAVAVLYCLAA